MSKIVGQTRLSSIGHETSREEGRHLNSKPEECCFGESVTHWFTILQLSAHSKSVAGSTMVFTTINKSPV